MVIAVVQARWLYTLEKMQKSAIDEIALRRPTLDDAFIKLTGHAAQEERLAGEEAAA